MLSSDDLAKTERTIVKSLILAVFIYFLVPGSGQLLWDGMPLSTRAEFVTLIIIALAVSNRKIRSSINNFLGNLKWRGALVPALTLLAVLKVLTFAWYPFSDGFDACYRSLYNPLENQGECEKSYEGPFLIRDDIPFDNTSRIDRTVDFGVHTHDWSLPFMNEYPRLGTLWLERFPFTATYGAVIRNDSDTRKFLPIYGNGEMAGSLGQQAFGTSDVPLVDRYEFPRIFFLEVPRGSSEFILNYRFSDDDASKIPDVAPAERGPYARLKIGQLYNRKSLLEFTKVRVRGWTVDKKLKVTPDYITAVDSAGNELDQSDALERPDVGTYVGLPGLTKSGFDLSLPANALTLGDVTIQAVYKQVPVRIATLSASDETVPALPDYKIDNAGMYQSGIDVWFDTDRNDFSALKPGHRFELPLRLVALLVTLDFVSALTVLGFFIALLLGLRRSIGISILMASTAIAVLVINEELLSRVPNTGGLVPAIALSLMVVLVLKLRRPQSYAAWLPLAVVLAAYKSLDHLERFHASRGQRWWGRLIFYWRDSDWYATQGFARSIFLTGSLQGGESLFWFQAGPRYLALVTRSLFGEQDALIGMVTLALGFFVVLVLGARFLEKSNKSFDWLVGGCAIFAMLYFLSNSLMVSFGFLGSSEYPTWIVMFVTAGFAVSTRTESRTWPMVALAVALGYSIQLRPNQIGGVVLMFVAMLLLVDRSDTRRAVGTISKMIAAFAAVSLFSLWHNLYYAETFVPFAANAGINYQFSWLDVLGIGEGGGNWRVVASQLRIMMYWNAPGSLSWASLFWGAQLSWIVAIVYRYKKGLLFKAKSLLLLIPFGYALPMLKYQMTSYYPRHLVAINLAFLLTALMAWPHSEDSSNEKESVEPESAPPNAADSAVLSAPSR